MPDRISALHGYVKPGRYGKRDSCGVTMTLCEGPDIQQIACWPETVGTVEAKLMAELGLSAAPGPNLATTLDVSGKGVSGQGATTLMRVEPLKWWLLGAVISDLAAETGTTLDLSHSRTHLLVSGSDAAVFLNRHLPVDLRDASFPVGHILSTGLHHTSVLLWRSSRGYELFLPRAFALSLFELLCESAASFGYELRKL